MPAASQDFDADGTPTALEDSLGLVTGTLYTVSYVGDAVAMVRVAASQPAATARGHPLGPYESLAMRPEAGVKTWAWSRDPDGAALIVTEAA